MLPCVRPLAQVMAAAAGGPSVRHRPAGLSARIIDTDGGGKADTLLELGERLEEEPAADTSKLAADQRGRFANQSRIRRASAHTLDPRMQLGGSPGSSSKRGTHDGLMFASSRATVFRLLERPRSSRAAFTFFLLVVFSILASSITYGLSTVGSISDSKALLAFEVLCNLIFNCELALRLFSMPSLRALLVDATFYVDVLSLLPWWIDVVLWLSGGGAFGSSDVASAVQVLRLFRLLRILKLLRHYSGWRVLLLAVERSWRPIFVPMFAMLVVVLILGGVLQFLEEDTFDDAFEAMWAIFWLVATQGYEDDLGSGSPQSRLVIALAVLCGVLFTTMPITIVGNAFATAWEKKEVIEVALKVRDLLEERGLQPRDVALVFNEFDLDGTGTVDFQEFRTAMCVLHNEMPWDQMKRLFLMFDADDNGAIDHREFCSLIFPGMGHAATGAIIANLGMGGDGDAPGFGAAAQAPASTAAGPSGGATLEPRRTAHIASPSGWPSSKATRVAPNVPITQLLQKAKEQASLTREAKQANNPDLRTEIRELRTLVEAQAKSMEEQARSMAAMQKMVAALLQHT